MALTKIFGYILAALLMVSSVAHALGGLPALQQQLSQLGASPGSELWVDATAGWLFGSMSMLAFAIIMASIVRELPQQANLVPVTVIGVGYLAFGIGSLARFHWSIHFIGFTIFGLLILVWSFVAQTRTKTKRSMSE